MYIYIYIYFFFPSAFARWWQHTSRSKGAMHRKLKHNCYKHKENQFIFNSLNIAMKSLSSFQAENQNSHLRENKQTNTYIYILSSLMLYSYVASM